MIRAIAAFGASVSIIAVVLMVIVFPLLHYAGFREESQRTLNESQPGKAIIIGLSNQSTTYLLFPQEGCPVIVDVFPEGQGERVREVSVANTTIRVVIFLYGCTIVGFLVFGHRVPPFSRKEPRPSEVLTERGMAIVTAAIVLSTALL